MKWNCLLPNRDRCLHIYCAGLREEKTGIVMEGCNADIVLVAVK